VAPQLRWRCPTAAWAVCAAGCVSAAAKMNENPLEETRGNLEQFGATAQARTSDALSRALRPLDDEAAVDGPLTAER